jgi:hypothetical protein
VADWWDGRTRQALAYLGARVALSERERLAASLTPAQLALFDSMHVADQRHGLDVRAALVAAGHDDPDLLAAAVFHDAAKGPGVGLLHRVSWSLGERYGAWAWRTAALLPGFARAHERLRDHAERSAELALAAGCSARTAALIREQAHPADAAGRALLVADEAH